MFDVKEEIRHIIEAYEEGSMKATEESFKKTTIFPPYEDPKEVFVKLLLRFWEEILHNEKRIPKRNELYVLDIDYNSIRNLITHTICQYFIYDDTVYVIPKECLGNLKYYTTLPDILDVIRYAKECGILSYESPCHSCYNGEKVQKFYISTVI